MKKIIGTIFLCVVFAMLLSACSSVGSDNSSADSSSEEQSTGQSLQESSGQNSRESSGQSTQDSSEGSSRQSTFDSSGTGDEPGPAKDGELYIKVLDVGKADAIILYLNGKSMLIDTGYSSNKKYIKSELESAGITKLDYLLITHFHKDHVGSAAYIVKKFEIGEIIYPDYVGNRDEYDEFMAEIAGHPNAHAVSEQTKLDFGADEFLIIPATETEEILEKEEPDNDMSLVCRLKYGKKTFLFTGDIKKDRISQLLDQDIDLSCDWLKLPHHGRYQKIITQLLDVCAPEYAIITDSSDEPAEEKTLAALNARDIEIYRTTDGDIITRCDGEKISIAP